MPARLWLDTDGLADDWPPPHRSLPRWVRWALPLAALAMMAGAVYGFGGFEQRRYRPDVHQPGTLVTMDGFDFTPTQAFLYPKSNKLASTVDIRVIGTCENRRDDTVSLSRLARAGILVADPLNPTETPDTELWVGTWTGVGSLTSPPGQGVVPCHVLVELPDTFKPTGIVMLQVSNVTYADRTVLQIGDKSWGGATQEYIYYIPLSHR